MALMIEAPTSRHPRVVDAVLRAEGPRHRLGVATDAATVLGRPAEQPLSVVSCVTVGATVEIIAAEPEFAPARLAAIELAAAGWDVVVLVPSAEVGEAHRLLRGAPCGLQTWWFEDDAVQFGARRTP